MTLRRRPPTTTSPTVLIVEHEDAIRLLRRRVLERAGFVVREARNGREAIADALGEPAPDLILLEVRLPDADGFTVCEQVKAARASIPVVFVSAAHRTAQARRDGFAAGGDAYLTDPTPPDELVRVVRELLAPPSDSAPIA